MASSWPDVVTSDPEYEMSIEVSTSGWKFGGVWERTLPISGTMLARCMVLKCILRNRTG
jgi:hypothetical protein